jgi:uncharacterized RDD family membrane protein YckC
VTTDPNASQNPDPDPFRQYPSAPPPPESQYGYGQPYPMPGGPPPVGMPPFAGWFQRVRAWLIDNFIVGFVFGFFVSLTNSRLIEAVGAVVALVWSVYNAVRAGRTGQSIGKRTVGIRLARQADGLPVGAGYGLLRWFLNLVFTWACVVPGLLNYLWPLWDRHSQTWSDKIAKSVVVKV